MNTDFHPDVTRFPKELTLMLMLLNLEEGESVLPGNVDRLEEIDWNYFIELARHHRIFPIVYLKLRRSHITWIPPHVVQTLYRDYKVNTMLMLQLSAEMGLISKLFAESGIRTLVLKGPVLAEELYGDISLRTSGDLDILLPIQDLARAEELLERLGYVKDDYIQTVLNDWKWRHHHCTFYHQQKNIKIELHWRLSPGPGKEPRFNVLWERKRISTISGHPVYYLGREDLFLFLAAHGARHGWSRLRWLADMDLIARQRQLDWSKLMQLLRKHHLVHIGAQALILASQLLNTPLTSDMQSITSRQRPHRLAQDALFYIRQMVNLHTNPVPDDVSRYHSSHVKSLMSSHQKLLFTVSLLYPYPLDAEMLPLPRSLHFIYFLFRPILCIWRQVKKHALQKGGV